MKISFLRESERESLETVSYYGEIRPDLGRRFKEEVDRSLLWIGDRPEVCRLRPGGYRRINLRIFPFYVPYIVREPTRGFWRLLTPDASPSIGFKESKKIE